MQIRIRGIGQKCWKSSDIDRKTPNILRMFGELSWQGMRDSNPRKRSQSPVCYRYTNPLYVTRGHMVETTGLEPVTSCV